MIKGQIAGLMRQAQQMQENMKKAQEALADIEVEGLSGGGLVKIIITCDYTVKKFFLDPSLLNEDRDLLEDLIIAAFNDAIRKARLNSEEKMSSVTGGLPIPAGMKFPL
ncbi:MAG: YbaB/EbfC family nucleoid-associated protein [Bordetella sp.]|nr:MAG: YbaB/EbfC family nucleoid-associated protein [Bordetella sp.]